MAIDIETIGLDLRTDGLQRGRRELGETARAADRAADAATRAGSRASSGFREYGSAAAIAERQTRALADTTATFGRLMGTVFAGMGAGALIGQIDAYTKYTAQLKLASTGAADFANSMDNVRRIASTAQADLASVGTLYARISASTKEMGLSQQKVAAITETVGLSLKVSGASAGEAASAMLQLSQAFGSGRLNGQEFAAIAESAPGLLQILADSMGRTRGELKGMSEAGKLTTEVMAKAFSDPVVIAKLQEQAKQVQTIGGAFTVLKNNVMEFTGAQAQTSGAVSILTGGIGLLANNLGLLAGGLLTVTAVKFATWMQSLVTGAYASVTANQALMASNLATAQAQATATAAAAALTATRVAELRASVLAAEGAVALAITTNGLIPAQARAAVAADAHAVSLTALAAAQRAASVTGGMAAGAMAFLGGPVGAIVTLLGLGATAWMLWGKSSADASKQAAGAATASAREVIAGLDSQIEKLRQRNALLRAGNTEAAKAEAPQSEKAGQLFKEINRLKALGNQMTEADQKLFRTAVADYNELTKKVKDLNHEKEVGEKLTQGSKAAELMEKYATKTEQMNAELKKQKALLGDAFTPEHEKRIRAHYETKSSGAKSAAAAVKKEQSTYDTLIASIKTKIEQNDAEVAAGRKLNDAENMRVKLTAQMEQGSRKMTAAHQAEAKALLEKFDLSERALAISQAQKKFEGERDKEGQYIAAEIAKINEKAQALEDEAEAYGMGAEAIAALTIERLEEKKAILAGFGASAQVIQQIEDEIAARQRLGKASGIKTGLDDAAKESKKALEELNNFLDPAKASSFGDALKGAFEGAGSALASLVNHLDSYGQKEAEIAKMRANLSSETDPAKRAQKEMALSNLAAKAQINAYASMAGAAKGFFKEGSTGYKTMGAVEKAFRAVELAMAIKNTAVKMGLIGGEVAAKVTGNTAVAASGQASDAVQIPGAMALASARALGAVATQGTGDPYTAFPRIAAMIAIMAGLGLMAGVGGGNANTLPATNDGTGTVFGDKTAKSESITKTIDLLEGISKFAGIENSYAAKMLASLRSIESQIGGFTNVILRSGGIDGIGADMAAAAASRKGSGLNWGIDGLSAKIDAALFGKKVTVTGQGLYANDASIQQIAAGGMSAGYYTDVNTKKKAFGITYSDKNSINKTPDDEVSRQISLIVTNFADAVKQAGPVLGTSLGTIDANLQGFVLKIGRIDLKGLTGTEIQEKLNAVFGAAGDDIARAAIPGLEALQQVGEGYFETLARVASNLSSVNQMFDTLGVKLFDASIAGAEASLSMAGLFGGLENMAGAVGDYYEAFYTEEERTGKLKAQLAAELAKSGKEMPATKDAYRDMVTAALNAGEGGAELAAKLIKLAPAFAQVTDAERALQEVRDSVAVQMGINTGATNSYIDALAAAAGGMDTLSGKSANFYDKFFTDTEKNNLAIEAARASLASVGLQMPATAQGARDMMTAAIGLGEAGKGTVIAILNATDGIDAFVNGVKAVGTAVQTAVNSWEQRVDLNGLTGAVRGSWADLIAGIVSDTEAAKIELAKLTSPKSSYEIDREAIQAKAADRTTAYWTPDREQASYDLINVKSQEQARLEFSAGWYAGMGPEWEAMSQWARNSANAMAAEIAALTDSIGQAPPEIQALIEAEQALLDARNKSTADKTVAGLLKEIAQLDMTPLEKQLADIAERADEYVAGLQDLGQGTDANIAAVEAWEAAMIAAAQSGSSAAESMTQVTDDAFAALERAVGVQRDVLTEAISDLQAVFDMTRDAARDLYGEAESASQQSAAAGQAFIDNALANAQATGDMPDSDGLREAIEGVRKGIAAQQGTSTFEAERDRLVLAGKLTDLKYLAEPQLTEAQRQLAALEEMLKTARTQIDELRGINVSVLSVADAMTALAAAIAAEKAVVAPASGSGAGGSGSGSGAGSGSADTTALDAWGVQLLERNAATYASDNFNAASADQIAALQAGSTGGNIWITAESALATLNAASAASLTAAGLVSRELTLAANSALSMADRTAYAYGEISASDLLSKYNIPGFATGGMHTGGLRIVGENGPELEATGPSRIWNAQQLSGAMGGGNTARLEALVEGLTVEVQRLQGIVARGVEHQRETAEILDGVTEGGNAMRTEVMA